MLSDEFFEFPPRPPHKRSNSPMSCTRRPLCWRKQGLDCFDAWTGSATTRPGQRSDLLPNKPLLEDVEYHGKTVMSGLEMDATFQKESVPSRLLSSTFQPLFLIIFLWQKMAAFTKIQENLLKNCSKGRLLIYFSNSSVFLVTETW